jgi:hypothetical protein
MNQITRVIDIIWDNCLEPMPDIDYLRQLTCGCIVMRDHDYLDLFVWTGNTSQCEADYAHELILSTKGFSNGDDTAENVEEITAAVAAYTDGWGDEGGELRDMLQSVVH